MGGRRSRLAVLNNRHAYFLLVDNGSVGRYGAEIVLRRKLEKYIAAQKLHPCKCAPAHWARGDALSGASTRKPDRRRTPTPSALLWAVQSPSSGNNRKQS
ncbi:Transient receptor potential cation channel trpm [Eumeta japonica]|uniref:Transient receptor potential cation channel trpm n=1 Tax=Eumeta variegata TaxID=151549 RepID=A0A4C1Z5E9_EUMVA|nr:Transient receptor potential cation channel trpm [Eumeta japonica]